MKYIIYKIDINTNKYYIGYTSNYDNRIIRHVRDLRSNCHHCTLLQDEYNKSTFDLNFTILEYFDNEKDAREKEELLINKAFIEDATNVLNMSKLSSGGDLLSYHPNKDDIIKQRSVTTARINSKLSKEELSIKYGKVGCRNGMFGKTHTAEVREILSKKSIGNTYSLGKRRSESYKQRLSIMASKRIGDKNPFFGKEHSDVTKALIGEANKGRIPPNARPISCNGVEYKSVIEATKVLGITKYYLNKFALSTDEKYSAYFYI